MKLLIAGSRSINDFKLIETNVFRLFSLEEIDEIVHGGARGVDKLAGVFAVDNKIKVKIFYADWNKYGKSAGMLRNKEMADYADFLLAFWNGVSKGTKNMIYEMDKVLRKPIEVVKV